MPAKRRTTRTGPTVRRRRHPRSPDKLLDLDCRLASEVIGLAGGGALTPTAGVVSEELGCTVEAAFTSDHARLGADTADLASDIRPSGFYFLRGIPLAAPGGGGWGTARHGSMTLFERGCPPRPVRSPAYSPMSAMTTTSG